MIDLIPWFLLPKNRGNVILPIYMAYERGGGGGGSAGTSVQDPESQEGAVNLWRTP
jgi:hypothetical protein